MSVPNKVSGWGHGCPGPLNGQAGECCGHWVKDVKWCVVMGV